MQIFEIKGNQKLIAQVAPHLNQLPSDTRLLINTRSQEYLTDNPKIIFGDFNDEEQATALEHYKEITSIGFYFQGKLIFTPIQYLISITDFVTPVTQKIY